MGNAARENAQNAALREVSRGNWQDFWRFEAARMHAVEAAIMNLLAMPLCPSPGMALRPTLGVLGVGRYFAGAE